MKSTKFSANWKTRLGLLTVVVYFKHIWRQFNFLFTNTLANKLIRSLLRTFTVCSYLWRRTETTPFPTTGVVVETASIKHIDTVGEFSLTTGSGRIRRINKQQLPGFPCQKPCVLLLYVLEQYPTYSIIVPSCTHPYSGTQPHRYIHSKEFVIGKYLKCHTLLFSYPTMRIPAKFVRAHTHTHTQTHIYIVCRYMCPRIILSAHV